MRQLVELAISELTPFVADLDAPVREVDDGDASARE
jgi:hypothetical protein